MNLESLQHCLISSISPLTPGLQRSQQASKNEEKNATKGTWDVAVVGSVHLQKELSLQLPWSGDD